MEDNEKIMAYLYDEMTPSEKEEFTKQLERNPALKKELNDLKGVRHTMKQWGNKEVIIPKIKTSHTLFSVWRSDSFKLPIGIAAGIVLVMIGARLLQFQAGFQNGNFTVSFGQAAGLTEENVQSIINSAWKAKEMKAEVYWKEENEKLKTALQQNLKDSKAELSRHWSSLSAASQSEIKSYAATLQQKNLIQIKDYLQLSATDQKKYLENLMLDFASYLDKERKGDLQLVQNQINNLKSTNTQFKQETEQILAGIISNLDEPTTSSQTKHY